MTFIMRLTVIDMLLLVSDAWLVRACVNPYLSFDRATYVDVHSHVHTPTAESPPQGGGRRVRRSQGEEASPSGTGGGGGGGGGLVTFQVTGHPILHPELLWPNDHCLPIGILEQGTFYLNPTLPYLNLKRRAEVKLLGGPCWPLRAGGESEGNQGSIYLTTCSPLLDDIDTFP